MNLELQQQKMDTIKWALSQEVGHDTCGEYDYCVHCNKDTEYPCARAFNKMAREARQLKKKK